MTKHVSIIELTSEFSKCIRSVYEIRTSAQTSPQQETPPANNTGELVMPVIVTGTFDSPHFAPDVQEIARIKLQNLVPSYGNPGNLTSGILGAVLGGNKKGGQQQQAQPANPLGDLLNSVMQGKKQQQPPPSPL